MNAKQKDGASARQRGRPAIAEGEDTVPVTIRLTRPQSQKLQRLGGAKWVRARIDRAKDPE